MPDLEDYSRDVRAARFPPKDVCAGNLVNHSVTMATGEGDRTAVFCEGYCFVTMIRCQISTHKGAGQVDWVGAKSAAFIKLV